MSDVPGGSLGLEPAPAETAIWTHDAADPVPSPAGDAFAFLAEHPDERLLGDRPDVLVFTAPTRTAPLDLAGPIRLDAAVGSDGPEMDLFVRLLDVAPDGSARLIARGQQTILAPGPSAPVTIDLGHTGYRLAAGHALRLTLSSSDAPEFVPAPGTGEHRWLAVKTIPNQQRIHLGDTRLTLTALKGDS